MEQYALLSDSSSDDDIELMGDILTQAKSLLVVAVEESRSRKGKKPNIDRLAQQGSLRLIADYFSEQPLYSEEQFRRRFRMRRSLFIRIVNDVEAKNEYFTQKPNAAGKLGLTALQKCTAAIRQLAYGMPSDAIDEYVRIAESTARQSMMEFCQTILDLYADQYLRSPNSADMKRLLETGASRGFPGMLGSLDCCHWEWKNCPTGWAGQYQGKSKKPTIILEAVASYDLWIWHAFFGIPGSNNDLNVLERSPLFNKLYSGKTPPVEFTINSRKYTTGYYLADGIYPPLATLVKTISSPVDQKRKHFAMMQESTRKDVERAFGVLMARFAILKNPARLWNRDKLSQIMRSCIVLHNMIIEDQRNIPEIEYDQGGNAEVTVRMGGGEGFQAFLSKYCQVHSPVLHYQLQEDLVEHLWKKRENKAKRILECQLCFPTEKPVVRLHD
ncbi:uncharacterized protein LOC129739346 [Uranotaenia lowii]|uniref:uncharacterized protein LOC129739346 n=1 Tax=Uranotaenia lowii TaxID=190385 RepID=UPI00247B0E23|nr:uncharacterized protein LOC129739346 [Uranotaenia lowii]